MPTRGQNTGVVVTMRRCAHIAICIGYTNHIRKIARITKKKLKDMSININDNMESSEAQKKAILDYMMQGHSITPIEALEKFRCLRLGARIWELKHKDGYIVYTDMVKDPKTGKRYAQYSM